jgi:hypothetical protein
MNSADAHDVIIVAGFALVAFALLAWFADLAKKLPE